MQTIIMAVCSIMLMLFAIITGGNIEWTLNLPATIITLGLARLSIIGALKFKPDTTLNHSIIFP